MAPDYYAGQRLHALPWDQASEAERTEAEFWDKEFRETAEYFEMLGAGYCG